MAEAARQLGTRSKHLLLALLQKDGPVIIASLAKQFGVSPRSIRYDLDEIEGWLDGSPVRLCRRPRVGIWIEGSDDSVQATRDRLGLVEDYRPVLSPDQRRNIIVARLLQRDEPVTSHALADELHVSRTTVFADLDNVEEWLSYRGLTLVRRSNYGLRIVGEESAWRQAVSDLLNEFAESGELGRLLMKVGRQALESSHADSDTDAISSGFSGAPHLLALLGGIDLTRVESIVCRAEAAAGVEFTTGAYSALVFHIAVAIQRLGQDKQVELPRERLAALSSHAEHVLARRMSEQITAEFGVEVPPAEVGNLTLHLIGSKVRGPSRRRSEDPGVGEIPSFDVEASAAAQIIIEEAEKVLGLPLTQSESLRTGLTLHLRPSLGRLRFGLPLTNPLLEELQALYPRIYAAAEKACAAVETVVGLKIPAEEAGYVAMHLGAAILRRRQAATGKRRVIVASTGGVGVNEMLAARLGNEFLELEVVLTSSVHGLETAIEAAGPDFVISTSSVPGMGVEVVVVDPLLTEDDIDKVRAFLDSHFRPDEARLLDEAAQPA